MKRIILVISAVFSFAAAAERAPFSRYESIIERQMFGALPEGFDPTKMPSEVQKRNSKADKELAAEQEKLKSSIHFSVINVRKDGKVEVGFTDNSDPKEPCHYFICEGDTAGGWTVVNADPEKASIVLEKDGVSLELTLGDNSAKGGGNMKRKGAATPATLEATPAPASAGRSSLLGTRSFTSLRSRRQRIAMEERSRQEEEAKRQAEEKAAQAEKEAAREAEHAAEREEMRERLSAMSEEMRQLREARAKEAQAKEAQAKAEKGGENENDVVE
ncbi:MAG: hypothetical protein J6R63_01225 [Kiritimatiellae bacterium]|nr:hypothetical protein [Kiritimatiellia bacterium]